MDESALKRLLDNLDISRSSLHGWLHFWTFLVVVGVALEVVFVVWEYAEDMHDFRRGIVHPPAKPSALLLVLGLLGAGLVAIGVAGELYIDVQAGRLETEIRKVNELRISLLMKEATDLREFTARLSRTARHRAINNRAFIWDCIVGRPVGTAEIWYKADEPDEPKFGNDLYHALKSAPKGVSPWEVSEPKPFTPKILHGPHMRNIVVVGNPIDFHHLDRDDNSAFGALHCALSAGVDGPGLDMFWEDKTLPANHFVITIYGREDTAP